MDANLKVPSDGFCNSLRYENGHGWLGVDYQVTNLLMSSLKTSDICILIKVQEHPNVPVTMLKLKLKVRFCITIG